MTIYLKIAEKLAHTIFTASLQSFRLLSNKVKVMGHGIDTEQFKPLSQAIATRNILNVDRISPTKRQRELIVMFKYVHDTIPDATLHLVGQPIQPADQTYFHQLREYVQRHGLESSVVFHGAIPHRELIASYHQARVYVNLSTTGSLDKTVLEAMACNVPVVTTNEAFKDMLSSQHQACNVQDAAGKVQHFLMTPEQPHYREVIVRDHSLDKLIRRLIIQLEY